jgi:hypothetical protein
VNIIIFWSTLYRWAILESPSVGRDPIALNTYIIYAIWYSIGEDWRNIFLFLMMVLFPFGSLLSVIAYKTYSKDKNKKDMMRSLTS